VNRKEAVTIFTELVANGFVLPNLVSIEQESPEKCILKIKGDYDSQKIMSLLNNRGLSCEQNKDYLIIYKPRK
jgi:hypothetical protein